MDSAVYIWGRQKRGYDGISGNATLQGTVESRFGGLVANVDKRLC